MAWLVLLAIAFSILSATIGQPVFEGTEKNGVRRAASQLERKVSKGDSQRILAAVIPHETGTNVRIGGSF